MRRYHNKIQSSSLVSFVEEVKSKKYVFVILELLIHLNEIFSTLLVAIGIGEGKFNTFDEFIEHEIEF